MNWKFTRATSTRFEQDEPIAMLVPQQRGNLESYAVYTVSPRRTRTRRSIPAMLASMFRRSVL
jgi:hypothetical protein